MGNREKVVMLLSGGMDSSTLLYWVMNSAIEVIPIAVDYGQRHSRELLSAEAIVQAAKARGDVRDLLVVPMEWMATLLPGNSQTDASASVPHGHYADESMRKTVVPNRNMFMLAIAAAIGIANGCRAVVYGAHSGDHAIYPDCREEFAEAMRLALSLCHDDGGIELLVPFLKYDKTTIARIGVSLGVPYELTWTCYEGGERPCMRCGSCVERAEAFASAGAIDPLVQQ